MSEIANRTIWQALLGGQRGAVKNGGGPDAVIVAGLCDVHGNVAVTVYRDGAVECYDCQEEAE